MKFVTFNIQYGIGADGKFDLSRIAPAVDGADVIALQEVDRFWRRTGQIDQPAQIAQALPEYYWVYGPNLDMDASTRDQDGRLVNRRKQFGNMLLSRRPFLSSRNFPLPKMGTLTHHSIQQGLLEGVIEAPDGPLRVYSVHLSHLVSEFRRRQLETIMDIYAHAPAGGGAWCGGHPDASAGWTEEPVPPMPDRAVMMGDFNLTTTSADYAMLVGPKSRKMGRINLSDRLVDSWVAAGKDEADGVTCPSDQHGASAGERIDYCFVSPEFANRISQARIDTDCQASDHRPYWVSID